jgi:hypothetical protein
LNEKGSSVEKLMNKKRCLAIMVIAAATVLLLASSCTINFLPVITSLEAEAPGWTAPLGSLHVTCNASNPQGSELSYSWSADGGNISGTGPEVIWTAPEEVGMYDITVVVVDNVSLSATRSIALTASNGPPPNIENLIVTAEQYLRKTTTGYNVAQTYNYTIKCIASGNGTLSYNWSCTGGNISGGGSNITWTAPNTEVDVTVTVTVKVFDGAANWVKKSIIFEVKSCTCRV